MSDPLRYLARMDNQLDLPLVQDRPRIFIDFPMKPIATQTINEIQRARAYLGVGEKSRAQRRRHGNHD